MRLPLLVALIVLFGSGSNAAAQGFGVGGLLPFNEKCASCHVNPEPGSRAPTRAQLQGQAPEAILAAMTTGGMAPMASGLSEGQMTKSLPAGSPAIDSAAPAKIGTATLALG